MGPLLVAGLAASGLLTGARARADAIGPPPDDCVEGSAGESCHGGAYCRARGCTGPSDCMIGERCASRELCALSFDCYWDVVPAISGRCGPATECAAGSTCTSLFVCVPAAPLLDAGRPDAGRRDAGERVDAPAPGGDAGPGERFRTSYCGCSVPSRARTPAAVVLVALAALVALGRRRAACKRRARLAMLGACARP